VHLYDLVHDLNTYLEQNHAPVKSMNDILESGLYHPGILDNLLNARKLSVHSSAYTDRLARREALQEQLRQLIENEALDALIFPHQQQLVCKVGGSQLQRNGALAAITGFPSVCVPAGFSPASPEAPIGVPIGFELFGLPYTETKLIELASLFEYKYPKRELPLEDDWL
jgi:amidase